MSHEAIVAAYAHTPDLGEAWGPLSQDTVVLAGIQVGFLPLSDVNHAVRAHQESA
jgi:hypothetical protein